MTMSQCRPHPTTAIEPSDPSRTYNCTARSLPPHDQPTPSRQYLAEREAFIELNSEVSGTYATLPLTPAEERVNSHLVSERDAFVIDNTEASTFPPQQFFYEWQHRDDVLNSNVWSLLESMPKGAALHLHTGSCGPTDWLISEGLSMDGAFVYWGEDQPDVCLSNLGGAFEDPILANLRPSSSPNLPCLTPTPRNDPPRRRRRRRRRRLPAGMQLDQPEPHTAVQGHHHVLQRVGRRGRRAVRLPLGPGAARRNP